MYYDVKTKNVAIISVPAIYAITATLFLLLSIIGVIICNIFYGFNSKNIRIKNIFLRTNSKVYPIVGMLQAFIIVYKLSEMAMVAENCAIEILKIHNYIFIIAFGFFLMQFSDITKRIKTGQFPQLLQILNYVTIILANIYLFNKVDYCIYNITNNIIGNHGSQLQRSATTYLIITALIFVIEVANKIIKKIKSRYISLMSVEK